MLRYFNRPIVNFVSVFLAVIGISASVYFYLQAQEHPGLSYYVHPAKAAVVRADNLSRLVVEYDGQKLTRNITVAQVAFWNAGKKAIRRNAILRPLVIRTGKNVQILEAKIRKVSREVIAVNIDSSKAKDGEIVIKWNILEKDDGGIVQLVYVGNEDVNITASATIEGQGDILDQQFTDTLQTPLEQYNKKTSIATPIVFSIILLLGVIMTAKTAYDIFTTKQSDSSDESLSKRYGQKVAMLVYGALFIVMAVWFLVARVPPSGPPFGF